MSVILGECDTNIKTSTSIQLLTMPRTVWRRPQKSKAFALHWPSVLLFSLPYKRFGISFFLQNVDAIEINLMSYEKYTLCPPYVRKHDIRWMRKVPFWFYPYSFAVTYF